MDTKSKAERFLNMMTGDESMLAQDGIEVAQAYLDQCQEVDRLKAALLEAMEWNWLDDDAPPRFDIDNLPELEDKQ